MSLSQLPSLKSRIRAEAQRLGFVLCGFTTPDPPAHYHLFDEWLSSNRHAGMSYLATQSSRQHRAHPRSILPDCQTIICLAAAYPRPDSISTPGIQSPTGRVAAYAWGKDYHQVLPPRLEALIALIQSNAPRKINAIVYTDTGPLLEKELAQRAGLGWIGKNTCLINPRIGSFLFLAEILLDLPLEPDTPVTQDYCGSCRRCIAACPTGCILPDRTLDAAHCLSYLTIENRSDIPLDLRSKLRPWVFGCDICQIICPWNQRFAPETGDPAFNISAGAAWLDLHAIIQLSAQDFKGLFSSSAISRARRKGLQVSAMIALGNQGDPSSLPVISNALLTHDLPVVRKAAVWALCQYGNELSRPSLKLCLASETDLEVRQTIVDALE